MHEGVKKFPLSFTRILTKKTRLRRVRKYFVKLGPQSVTIVVLSLFAAFSALFLFTFCY